MGRGEGSCRGFECMRQSSAGPFLLPSWKSGVEVWPTDRVRVPSRLLRKSIRHWEGRRGCSVPLLLRGLFLGHSRSRSRTGAKPGLPAGRLGACVTSSPAGCGEYAGLPWPGKSGLRSGSVISGASRKRGCPITTSRVCR